MREKQRLVVIGNGMAGARLVEDVLSRGGGALYDIVVFGDEPYGNYNRILLSGVLAGTHDPKDIFINPLAWYDDNAVRLHAGVRVLAIDRAARRVRGTGGIVEAYDKLVIATGGKPYYLAGLMPALLVAGSATVDRWLDRGAGGVRRALLAVALAVSAGIAALISLPIVPAKDAAKYRVRVTNFRLGLANQAP